MSGGLVRAAGIGRVAYVLVLVLGCLRGLSSQLDADVVARGRYSGVLEWRNAVVLWVNADGGQYDNLFLEGGRHMTWFAGSRCTPETPVVQRLLRGAADKEEEGAEEKEEEQILLFCRNNGEPYVFLGRVGVVEYELRRHPIKVIWRLADFDAVRDQPDFHEVSKGISAS